MTRDDWLRWHYQAPNIDLDDPGCSDQLLQEVVDVQRSKQQFLQRENNRGWIASYIEGIGNKSWNEDLAHEDPFDIPDTIIEWCKKNCIGRWNCNDPVWWEFELESDALAFKLVWGN